MHFGKGLTEASIKLAPGDYRSRCSLQTAYTVPAAKVGGDHFD